MYILKFKGILLHFCPKTEGTLVVSLPKFKGKLSYPVAKSKELAQSMTSETTAYWGFDPTFCAHKPSH